MSCHSGHKSVLNSPIGWSLITCSYLSQHFYLSWLVNLNNVGSLLQQNAEGSTIYILTRSDRQFRRTISQSQKRSPLHTLLYDIWCHNQVTSLLFNNSSAILSHMCRFSYTSVQGWGRLQLMITITIMITCHFYLSITIMIMIIRNYNYRLRLWLWLHVIKNYRLRLWLHSIFRWRLWLWLQ